MWATFLLYLYVILVVLISLFGVHSLVMAGLFLPHSSGFRNKEKKVENETEDLALPYIAVQLPIYNERFVASRLIDAVCAFDYPLDKLQIQVLDDSTDETAKVVANRVAHFQARGFNIVLWHRDNRHGFKAGALADALKTTEAEYVAVFDADFMPHPDFLKQVIPYFLKDKELGMVQGRWGHLNRSYNLVTRAQSLFLDGHVIVEQTARSRSGLLFNFNGSGGIWRAECIRDSGGWQWDTFSEDIDLSYRAQFRGWHMIFLPDVIVPAEIPLTITAFKKQQYRWAFGTIQVLRKTLHTLWSLKSLSFARRLAGTFHLSTNLMYPVGMLVFLISVPLAYLQPHMPPTLGLLSAATAGPSVMFAVAQLMGYSNGLRRLLALPLLIIIGIGITISNTKAVFMAFTNHKMIWNPTPKYNISSKKNGNETSVFSAKIDSTVWLELFMTLYMGLGLGIAIDRTPSLIPLMTLGMLSFGYVSIMGLVDAHRPKKKAQRASSSKQVETA